MFLFSIWSIILNLNGKGKENRRKDGRKEMYNKFEERALKFVMTSGTRNVDQFLTIVKEEKGHKETKE